MKDLQLDRIAAISMVEAGYMPLARYIELFGNELPKGADLRSLAGAEQPQKQPSDLAHRPSWWRRRPARDAA